MSSVDNSVESRPTPAARPAFVAHGPSARPVNTSNEERFDCPSPSQNGALNGDDVGEVYSEAEAKLLAKVSEVIDLMSKHMLPPEEILLNLTDINNVLLWYEDVAIKLGKITSRMQMNVSSAKDRFTVWKARKISEKTAEVNGRSTEAKKLWYSPTQIEDMVISENETAWSRLRADIARAEAEWAFVNRMTDTWAGYQFVINQLSKNTIHEGEAGKVSAVARTYDSFLDRPGD